jgi:hypothetical protein
VKANDRLENVASDYSRFATGAEVWWRSIVDGRVGYTIPTTVLIDDEVCVALLQRHGCICKRRRGLRDGPRGRVSFQPKTGTVDTLTENGRDLIRSASGPLAHRLASSGTGTCTNDVSAAGTATLNNPGLDAARV